MSPSTRTLDYIVYLTPPGAILETAEQFRKLRFKLVYHFINLSLRRMYESTTN